MHEFPAHGYAAHIAEVEVDEETGTVELIRLICAHDIGQAVNRGGLEGQIEGGAAQGIGFALIEEMCYEGGVLVNGALVAGQGFNSGPLADRSRIRGSRNPENPTSPA